MNIVNYLLTKKKRRLIIKNILFLQAWATLTGDGDLYLHMYTLTLPIHSFPRALIALQLESDSMGSASANLAPRFPFYNRSADSG